MTSYNLKAYKLQTNFKMRGRNSYASIEKKKHKDASKSNFRFTNLDGSINDEDLLIAEELVEIIESYKTNLIETGCGEWMWIQQNKQNDFLSIMAKKNPYDIAIKLRSMFQNDATYGYLSPSYLDAKENIESTKSDILNNIDTCIEFTDIEDINYLATPEGLGEPFGLIVDDGIILPDSPRHYYYSSTIKRQLSSINSPFIVEIGGGYGSLCRYLANTIHGSTICNIDLFPALIVSYYLLRKSKIKVCFIHDKSELILQHVNLLVADSFNFNQRFSFKPNLFFNARSLCETSILTCTNYIKFINDSETCFFYHENSNFQLFPDSKRHIELISDDFNSELTNYNLNWKCITPFTGGNGRYREYMFELK